MKTEILNINNRPLKYIVTKHKDTINLLKDTGALIIYEPLLSNDVDEQTYNEKTYRELWVNKYLLTAGFGAKSKDEQNKLSDIAESYDDQYSYLYNKIDNTYNTFNDKYNELNRTKVSKGSETNNIVTKGSDISYNEFTFGNSKILLKDLYDKFSNIKQLYKFEITNISYSITLLVTNNQNLSNEYAQEITVNNNSYVPVGSKIKSITINIIGNTNDSGGIQDLNIVLNNQYSDTKKDYGLSISDIYNKDSIPNSSNIAFNLTLTKNFSSIDKYLYQINTNINQIIKSIQITTYPTAVNSNYINTLDGETLTDIIKDFPCILYGANTIYECKNDDTNRYPVILTNYQYKCSIGANETLNYLSLLIDSNIRLVEAKYIDYVNCQTYDIIDFILTKYNTTISGKTYNVKYFINLKNDINSTYNKIMNPPFLYKTSESNNLYLHEGEIIFTFIESNKMWDPTLKNTTDYWISYVPSKTIPL